MPINEDMLLFAAMLDDVKPSILPIDYASLVMG